MCSRGCVYAWLHEQSCTVVEYWVTGKYNTSVLQDDALASHGVVASCPGCAGLFIVLHWLGLVLTASHTVWLIVGLWASVAEIFDYVLPPCVAHLRSATSSYTYYKYLGTPRELLWTTVPELCSR